MSRYFLFLITILFTCLANSCLIKNKKFYSPCNNSSLGKKIENSAYSNLVHLEKILERQRYADDEKRSCKAALLARIKIAQGKDSEASQYFSLAAKKNSDLAEYFLLAKAQVELRRQNFNNAHNIASALISSHAAHISTIFARQIRIILADIAINKKDDIELIKTHKKLMKLGFKEDHVYLFNLARALKKTNHHKKADEVLKKLLTKFPASKSAKQITKLKNIASFDLTLKEVETRLNNLVQSLAFEDIFEDIQSLRNSKNSLKFSSMLNKYLVKSFVLKNEFEEGIKHAQSFAKNKKSTSKDLQLYAFSLAKVDRFIEASEVYKESYLVSNKKKIKAKGCFFAGFSLYEASLYSMARMEWYSCRDYIKGSMYEENYYWYQALSAILDNDFRNAFNFLKNLHKTYKKDKYKYFLAYSFLMQHKYKKAKKIFKNLANEKQPSYYSLLARKRLNLPNFMGKARKENTLQKFISKMSDPNCQKAKVLFNLGFDKEASELILDSKAKKEAKLAYLLKMEKYHDVWQRSYLINPKIKIEKDSFKSDDFIRIKYPLAHSHMVEQSCKKYSINQNLIYAIMREESGFYHEARSNRGAMGLMQMMPFVAKDLALKLGIKTFSKELLTKPNISIELGVLFVARLKRQFLKPHRIVSAYNAGPHIVQKWVNSFGHLNAELFIERIPFKQTRDYTKKVLSTEGYYHALKGNALRLVL